MSLLPSLALLVLVLAAARPGDHIVNAFLKGSHCKGVAVVNMLRFRYDTLFLCSVKACILSDLLLHLGLWPFIPFTCRCLVRFLKLLGREPISGPLDTYLLAGYSKALSSPHLLEHAKTAVLKCLMVEGCPVAVICWSWKSCPQINSLLWQMKSWK